MTTEYTPGPWFSDESGKIWRRPPSELYERGGGVAGDHPVAQAFRGHSSWEQGFPVESNARLISAAPDMLAALEAEEEWRAREEAGALDPEWDYDTMVASKRRAAIAKARGAQ